MSSVVEAAIRRLGLEGGRTRSIYLLVLVANTPLLAEVVRKYVIHSDLVFIAGDIFVVGILIIGALWVYGRTRLPPLYGVTAYIFVLYSLLGFFLSGGPLIAFGIGLRAIFLPLIYGVLVGALLARSKDSLKVLYVIMTAWVVIAGTFAVIQVALGADNPINSSWGQQGSGIGDYSGVEGDANAGLNLFRPTSFFMHTGKFGQVIFALIIFRWACLAHRLVPLGPLAILTVAADLVAIAVSGQRATFLFAALASIGLMRIGKHGLLMGLIVGAGILGITGVLAIGSSGADVQKLVRERFLSVTDDIPRRLEANLIRPTTVILDRYLIAGDGLGTYTLGSEAYTGVRKNERFRAIGLGESSWTRLAAELGVPGVLLFALLVAILLRFAWRAGKPEQDMVVRVCGTFFLFWYGSLVLWANTADVFANSVAMTLGFALTGGMFSGTSKGKIAEGRKRTEPYEASIGKFAVPQGSKSAKKVLQLRP